MAIHAIAEMFVQYEQMKIHQGKRSLPCVNVMIVDVKMTIRCPIYQDKEQKSVGIKPL